MFRGAAVLAAACAIVLVAGCGGSGQASPPLTHRPPAAKQSPAAAQSTRASLVAKGAARVCDSLRPVASRVAAMKRPGFGELEHYSSVLGSLGQQAYQGPAGYAAMGDELDQAATFMGESAVAGPAKFLRLAKYEVQLVTRLCLTARSGHDRD